MQQLQTTDTDVEAAHVRVTPQELAQATAIVEARRDAEAKRLADTIALGEAVQQLGLAATPEELFAEVQALRANTQNTTKTETNSEVTNQIDTTTYCTWLAGFAVLAPILIMLIAEIGPHISAMGRTDYAPAPTAVQTLPFTPAQAQSFAPAPVANAASVEAARVRDMNPGLFQSLDLKEGQSAHCSINEIKSLARGANPASVWVTRKMSGYTWVVMRQGGTFRVPCYTTSADAIKIANGQPASVSGFKDGDSTTPITLPLEKFTEPTTTGTIGETVSFVQINGR